MHYRKLLLLPISLVLFSLLLLSCSEKEILTNEEKEWLTQNDEITIALFPYYPPYEFINENDTIEGILIEYISLIEDKIKHKFKRKYYFQWPILMEDLKNGKVDIVLQIQSTKDRVSYLNFYAQFFESPHVLTTRKNSEYNTINSLKNKTITVPKDYAIFENLKRKYPNHTFVEDDNDLACLQKLNSGVYDAYIGPKAVVNYLIKTKNLNNLQIASETSLAYAPGIAVDKKNKILNDIIIKATQSITDHENQSIIENWLYIETKPFYKKPNFILPAVLILISILIIVLGINFYLGFIVKQKTKELRVAKDIAEKDNQLITAFIENVSQEISAPMNGIIDFSKRLSQQKLTISEKKKYTKIITSSCEQLINSIDAILEISQLQTKQVRLNPEKTDLFEIFETVYSIFEIDARKKGISLLLNNNLTEKQRYTIIDKLKLIKVINGIVENSIKYTKKGAILISCMVQNSTLIIIIRDSGIGINLEDQQLIFKSFSKSKNLISKKYGGLGYGLTVAKENIDLMKGKLSFSSIPDKGSTFRIELPFSSIDPKKQYDSTFDQSKKIKSKEYIILIAEDGEVNFLFLKTIITKIKGYDFVIHRAKNGKEAVSLCENNNNIDLVLMDIKMPEMNGYDASREIKKIMPKLPIIAQTAYSTKGDIRKALKAGCDSFISKPIHPRTLIKILKTYL